MLWGRISGSTRASTEQCALQTCCAPCRQSVEYTQDNLTEAMRRIPSTGSSLGDANLLGTLRSIYNTPRPHGHTRQVWVQGRGGWRERCPRRRERTWECGWKVPPKVCGGHKGTGRILWGVGEWRSGSTSSGVSVPEWISLPGVVSLQGASLLGPPLHFRSLLSPFWGPCAGPHHSCPLSPSSSSSWLGYPLTRKPLQLRSAVTATVTGNGRPLIVQSFPSLMRAPVQQCLS